MHTKTSSLLLCGWVLAIHAGELPEPAWPANPYVRWTHGPAHDSNYFPIAVWLQSPSKARQYREAGINTYVGLWRGPTEDQLAELESAGLKLICAQNAVALSRRDNPTIIGWLHGDEPDNAQSLGAGKGYGPPVPPQKIVEDYRRLRAADSTRPVMLNLGQGVAWDGWFGRGVRTNHPEDYAEYLPGCDIASFDIYPAVHSSPEVAGRLWYVARGVERLKGWVAPGQVVWNCLECTHIQNAKSKPTPRQVRCEAWMALVHGSMGLIYFVHEWWPRFNEAALLTDPEMLAAVTVLNRQITELAPVLNSPTLTVEAEIASDNPDAPIAMLTKRQDGWLYLFCVAMRDQKATATFRVRGLNSGSAVAVLGENRSLALQQGTFQDAFQPWDVHLYRLKRP